MTTTTELEEIEIADILSCYKKRNDRVLDEKWIMDRTEESRMSRCLALLKREAEMEAAFLKRSEQTKEVEERAEKAAKMAMEIAKIRDEETAKFLRRHYLWEKDPSLRQLVRTLNAGYNLRDLQLQIQQKEYKKLQEKQEEIKTDKLITESLYNDREQYVRDEMAKMQKNYNYRSDLNYIMECKEQKRQADLEGVRQDRKRMDDIMKMYAEEDRRKAEQKIKSQAKIIGEMYASLEEKALRAQKQYKMELETLREMKRQAAECGQWDSIVAEARNKKFREKDQIVDYIYNRTSVEEEEQKKRADIIKLLQEQEYLEKQLQEDMLKKLKFEQKKCDNYQSLTEQMEANRRRQQQLRENDVAYRIQNEAIIAAETQKELEKQRKLKEKNHSYGAEIKKQIEDNQRRRKQQKEFEDVTNKSVFDNVKEWEKEVAAEREKIVEEHAPHLIGYLPCGVLKKEDVPILRRGANKCEKLASLPIEQLAQSRPSTRQPKCNPQCQILKLM